MSVQRVFAPLALPSSFVFRFASSPATSSLRPCQHVLRTFSSSQRLRNSSKRKMQTSTSYQPYSLSSQLPPPPPPPRNAAVPDTSIAGSAPLPPQPTKHYNPSEDQSSVSLPEKEAQKSMPVAESSTQTKSKSRPRLRARKAAMNLTPNAVAQLRELLDQPDSKLLKVGVKNKGCSGLAYHLEYVDKPGMLDEEVVQDGVKVIIDSKALMSIIGSEMDWVTDKLSQRFVFRNPNIKEQCGCGESFMV